MNGALPVDAPLDLASKPPESETGKNTAERAAGMLVATGQGWMRPSAAQRRQLAVAMAEDGKIVYGAAFDLVKVPPEVDLDDAASIRAGIRKVVFYEVKSTNKAT